MGIAWNQFAGIDKNNQSVFVKLKTNLDNVDISEIHDKEVPRDVLALIGVPEELIDKYVDAKIRCNYI